MAHEVVPPPFSSRQVQILLVIRYIYVPLGGSRRPVISTLLVFTFVALWHDLSLRLLAWGWLVSLFILPEIVAGWVLPTEKVRGLNEVLHLPPLIPSRIV